MTVLEKAKAKLDAAQRGMSYRLPGYDKSDLQWWTAYIEGAEDQKREDQEAAGLPWRSVEDPPKKSCKVIVRCVCNSTGETDVTTACYRERYQRFHMTGNRSHWRVTHWMWPWSEPEEVQE